MQTNLFLEMTLLLFIIEFVLLEFTSKGLLERTGLLSNKIFLFLRNTIIITLTTLLLLNIYLLSKVINFIGKDSVKINIRQEDSK